jgi:hypothetical protein
MFSLGFFELYYAGQRRPESRQNVVRTTQDKGGMFDLDCTVSPHRARIRSVFAPPKVLDEFFSRSSKLRACALLVHARKDIRVAGLPRGVPPGALRLLGHSTTSPV